MYLKFTTFCFQYRFVKKSKEHEEYLKRKRIQHSSYKARQKSKIKSLLISDSRNKSVVQKMHTTVETNDVISNNKMEAAVTNDLRGQSDALYISEIADVEILLPPYPTEEEEDYINTKASVTQNHNSCLLYTSPSPRD